MKPGTNQQNFTRQIILDQLKLEAVNIERMHRGGNKNNDRKTPKATVTKFYSYKINNLFSRLQKHSLNNIA